MQPNTPNARLRSRRLLFLLGHRSLARLKSDLAVRAIAERLGHRSAAPAEGNSRLPGRVDLVASRVVQLHVTFHEIRPTRAGGDLHGHVDVSPSCLPAPRDRDSVTPQTHSAKWALGKR